MALWVESLSVLLMKWKMVGKWFDVLESQLPHLKNGTTITPFHGAVVTIKLVYMMYEEQDSVHGNCNYYLSKIPTRHVMTVRDSGCCNRI